MCCTESNPAWLLVSLGALRPVAVLEVVYAQDLTYTVALANSSTGPWLTVASQYCVHCRQNVLVDSVLGAPVFRRHAVPGAPGAASQVPMTASHVRLLVTWSSAGGIGGCDDMCDWATDIYSFGVFSPGALPLAGLAAPPPPSAGPNVACPDVSDLVAHRAGIDAGGVMLTGGATLLPPGSGAHGSTAIRLTEALPLRRGAAEYTRIVRPLEECHTCTNVHGLAVSIHVWLGGASSLPGEGLAVSMVDADKQTPGATRYVQVGCGANLALPLHAISIVLDTAENEGDASCSEASHGTGIYLVSTLDADAAPLVLRSTVDTGTALFRAAEWLPLEFMVRRRAWVGGGQQSAINSGSGAGPLVPDFIHVNGTEVLTGLLTTGQLDAFYIVASALTSARGTDAHLVSMLHVSCQLTSLHLEPENWAGNLQPFTPPSMHQQPLTSSQAQASAADERSTATAAAAFFAAFGVTTAMLGAAAAASRLRRSLRAGTPVVAELASSGGADPDKLASRASFALAIDAGEAAAQGFDVFLSYRRADYALADTVHDKLRLATGLRVFKDVDGRMAGTRFGAELVRMVRSAPIFAPVVTLASLLRMAGAAEPDAEVDACLAEWLAALHFRAAGRVRLIHPLLAGEPPPPAQAASPLQPRFESLAQDPRYAAALAALPDAAPAATMQAVAAALCAIGDAPLSPEVAGMSVREIVAGAAGVLAGPVLAVDCAPDDLGLYIHSRYAPPMLRVAEEARAHAAAIGSRRTSLSR